MNKTLDFWTEIKEIFKKLSEKYDVIWQKRKRILDTQLLVVFILKLVASHNKQQGYGSNLIEFWEDCFSKNIALPQDGPVLRTRAFETSGLNFISIRPSRHKASIFPN